MSIWSCAPQAAALAGQGLEGKVGHRQGDTGNRNTGRKNAERGKASTLFEVVVATDSLGSGWLLTDLQEEDRGEHTSPPCILHPLITTMEDPPSSFRQLSRLFSVSLFSKGSIPHWGQHTQHCQSLIPDIHRAGTHYFP